MQLDRDMLSEGYGNRRECVTKQTERFLFPVCFP